MAIIRVKSESVNIVAMPTMTVAGNEQVIPRQAILENQLTEPKKETTAAASEKTVEPDLRTIIFSILAVVVVLIISVFINQSIDPDKLEGIKLTSDVTIFAFLYIAAQAIERLLEPISSRILPTAEGIKDRDLALAKFENSKKEEDGKNAANCKAKLATKRANRTVVFWAIATGCGLLASSGLKLYFLTTIGVADVPRGAEILVTGLVIGGGTKPLHDLISRIEKSKNNAEDAG